MTISMWGRYLVDMMEQEEVTSGITVWCLGGPSLAFKTREAMIYLDLYMGPSPLVDSSGAEQDNRKPEWGEFLRMVAVAVDPADIRQVDAVISTHDHLDHCHRESCEPIYRNTGASFVGPQSSVKLMKEWGFADERVRCVQEGDTLEFGNVRLTALPCKDFMDTYSVTYLIEADGVAIWDSADTVYFDGLREIGGRYSIDVAFLAIGRNPPNDILYLDLESAAKAAADLKAGKVVPIHWDLFKNTGEDPRKLAEPLASVGAKCDLHIMTLGDKLEVRK